MRRINLNLNALSLKSTKSPSFYESQVDTVIRKYNLSDANFKHFFLGFIKKSMNSINVETLRESISLLQKHVTLRINLEMEDDSDEYEIVRNKIKHNQRKGKRRDL